MGKFDKFAGKNLEIDFKGIKVKLKPLKTKDAGVLFDLQKKFKKDKIDTEVIAELLLKMLEEGQTSKEELMQMNLKDFTDLYIEVGSAYGIINKKKVG
ncbi:MAG: hypothetical protein ABEK36_04390, partial [Candidatus Aenigmatarchaeota archaeon]